MLAKSNINPKKKTFIWDRDNPIDRIKNKSWILSLIQPNIEEKWIKKKFKKSNYIKIKLKNQ